MKPPEHPNGGRVAAGIAATIAERYVRNGANSTFLPSEHMLSAEYGVARSTIRRSLAMLKHQGIVQPEHGRGCRILRKGMTGTDFRVAILQTLEQYEGRTLPELVESIRRQCQKRKWQVLSMDVEKVDPDAVMRTLVDAKVNAVALVISNREIMERSRKAGIHCIAVEAADEGWPIDEVHQGNYGAARQAARYLIERGHRRIGWIGAPVADNPIGLERLAGARSALIEHQLDFRPEDMVFGPTAQRLAHRLLESPDRPKAVMTMWHATTLDAIATMARLGIGSDELDLVGWGTERQNVEMAEKAREAKIRLAAMIWSVEEMAEVVVSRMQLHRLEPGLRPLHISIPSRLTIVEREQ